MFKNVCLFYFPGHFAMVMLYVIFTFFVEIMNTVYKLRKFNLLLFRDQKNSFLFNESTNDLRMKYLTINLSIYF